MSHVLRVHGHVFRVEPAFWIDEFIGPHTLAHIKAPYSGPFRRYDARTIGAEHEREPWPSAWPPAAANISVPYAHAGCLERDEHLVRPRLGNGQRMQLEYRRRAEAIDSGSFHRRAGLVDFPSTHIGTKAVATPQCQYWCRRPRSTLTGVKAWLVMQSATTQRALHRVPRGSVCLRSRPEGRRRSYTALITPSKGRITRKVGHRCEIQSHACL